MALTIDPKFTVSPRNGRRRYAHEPCEPFFVFHDTESHSAVSTRNYLNSLEHADQRAACYHGLCDARDSFILADPALIRCYHAKHGGNDGVGLALGCFKKDWQNPIWRNKDMRGIVMMTNLANMVLDIEDHCGWRAERRYRGQVPATPTGRFNGKQWKDARKSGNRSGFWAHGDIQPEDRTDPGWSWADWRFLFYILDKLEQERRHAT